jgi:hypothetical protein
VTIVTTQGGSCAQQLRTMQEAFTIVLFVVVGIAAVAAVWALATSAGTYEQIGRGGTEVDGVDPASTAEEAAEIRQMLQARNTHRVARGEAPIDVDAETERLLREL